jgi:secondary thiamine-phosphate synthase enzyme
MNGRQELVEIATPGRGLHDVTDRVASVVRGAGVGSGLCHLFLQHTSASLLVQENADDDVRRDLLDWLVRIAPDGDPRYRHTAEGPDDMSAHLRTAITATSLTIPVVDGRLALGTWQAIYVCEHRTSPHRRMIVVTVTGLERSDSDRSPG